MTIKTPKDLLPNRTDRTEKYKTVANRNIFHAREMHNLGHTTVAEMISVQIDGGKCYKCHAEFEKVKVNNIFAEFEYYRPTCSCFPTCWHCGKLIIEEKIKLDNLKYCPNCHVNLFEAKGLPTAKSVDKENEYAKLIGIQYSENYKGKK